jgi:hypothetical protein
MGAGFCQFTLPSPDDRIAFQRAYAQGLRRDFAGAKELGGLAMAFLFLERAVLRHVWPDASARLHWLAILAVHTTDEFTIANQTTAIVIAFALLGIYLWRSELIKAFFR